MTRLSTGTETSYVSTLASFATEMTTMQDPAAGPLLSVTNGTNLQKTLPPLADLITSFTETPYVTASTIDDTSTAEVPQENRFPVDRQQGLSTGSIEEHTEDGPASTNFQYTSSDQVETTYISNRDIQTTVFHTDTTLPATTDFSTDRIQTHSLASTLLNTEFQSVPTTHLDRELAFIESSSIWTTDSTVDWNVETTTTSKLNNRFLDLLQDITTDKAEDITQIEEKSNEGSHETTTFQTNLSTIEGNEESSEIEVTEMSTSDTASDLRASQPENLVEIESPVTTDPTTQTVAKETF